MRARMRELGWGVLALIPVLMLAGCAAPARPRVYPCNYTEDPVVIDGALDEPCWADAETLDFLGWKKEGGKATLPEPTFPAIGRLAWDRQNLYVGIEADDADIWGMIEERDGKLWTEDVLEVFLKLREDAHLYYEFEFSPRNSVLDIFYPSRGLARWDLFWAGRFNPPLKTAVKVRGTLNNWRDRDEGWTLEIAIPFSAFEQLAGKPPQEYERWRFTLCRYDYSYYLEKQELSTSAELPGERGFHEYESYDVLEFQKRGQQYP